MGIPWQCTKHGRYSIGCDSCGDCMYCCDEKHDPDNLITHEQLKTVCHHLAEDYEPWGNVSWYDAPPDEARSDCSAGCKFFVTLGGERGADWGVCANPKSHRAGRLTFEHQGCRAFEYGGCDADAGAEPAAGIE